MSHSLSSISVIVPVYQCAPLLKGHVESLKQISHKVGELIWVITKSPDTSCQMAREAAASLGGQVLEMPRGLYEAWSAGIAASKGKYLYFSTVGDVLLRPEGLSELLESIEKSGADVVFSRPLIWPYSRKEKKMVSQWPIFRYSKILKKWDEQIIPQRSAIIMQILSGANGLLGSCASCLFRASAFVNRPFPTDYYHYGDSAWTYSNLNLIKLTYLDSEVAKFTVHGTNSNRIIVKNQIYNLALNGKNPKNRFSIF